MNNPIAYVESLPAAEQKIIAQEYEAYVKATVRAGDKPQPPPAWIAARFADKLGGAVATIDAEATEAPEHENAAQIPRPIAEPVDPARVLEIKRAFYALMIPHGHGTVMELAWWETRGRDEHAGKGGL